MRASDFYSDNKYLPLSSKIPSDNPTLGENIKHFLLELGNKTPTKDDCHNPNPSPSGTVRVIGNNIVSLVGRNLVGCFLSCFLVVCF